MEEYVSKLKRTSLNNYPHDATQFYPYGYSETSCTTSQPDDGLPEIIIHFAAPHDEEYMVIQSFDGCRTGNFVLYTEDMDGPFVLMAGNMNDGLIDGFCEVFAINEGKIFEGEWEDGKRTGSCVEYEFGNVSFQGAYRNDMRNGYGWEYHNNELQREGLWVNGEYQVTYCITNQVNFSSTGLGMTITRKDDDLMVITTPWEDNKANGFGYAYSMKQNEVVQGYLYLLGDGVENTERNTLPTSFTQGTLKMEDGSIWEGSISRNCANGLGVLRSPEGSIIYEGKMLDNMRYGLGKSFFPNGKVEYDGMWAFGRKMGNGTEFDESGNSKNSGVFIDNRFAYPKLNLTCNQEELITHVLLREFVIGDNLLNDVVEIDFTEYALLEKLVIGSNSLKELSQFNVKGLQCLQLIDIGRHSLTQCVCVLSPINLTEEQKKMGYMGRTISQNETRIRAEMKKMTISGCPLLEKVILKQGACSDFFECVIEDVPKLQVLEFGEVNASVKEEDGSYNFYYVTDLELRNLPSLQTLTFGNRSFVNALAFRVHDMDKLISLTFGNRSFFGKKVRGMDDKLVCASRFSWLKQSILLNMNESSVLIHIKDLPSLQTLKLNNNFVFYRRVVMSSKSLFNVKNCTTVEKTGKCFPSNPSDIEVENLHEEMRRVIKP